MRSIDARHQAMECRRRLYARFSSRENVENLTKRRFIESIWSACSYGKVRQRDTNATFGDMEQKSPKSGTSSDIGCGLVQSGLRYCRQHFESDSWKFNVGKCFFMFVCLSVKLSECRITQKMSNGFR